MTSKTGLRAAITNVLVKHSAKDTPAAVVVDELVRVTCDYAAAERLAWAAAETERRVAEAADGDWDGNRTERQRAVLAAAATRKARP